MKKKMTSFHHLITKFKQLLNISHVFMEVRIYCSAENMPWESTIHIYKKNGRSFLNFSPLASFTQVLRLLN